MQKLKPESKSQLAAVRLFLAQVRLQRLITEEQWWKSYHSWCHGGRAWNKLQSGGSDIETALAWYQHIHKPGSKEWRPSIIIDAVCRAAGLSSSQPTAQQVIAPDLLTLE